MIPCPSCGVTISLKDYFGRENFTCRACKKESVIEYFPALFKPFEKGQVSEVILEDIEASCYHHQNKKAVSSCSVCGIYVCALCEISKGDKKVCNNCFNQSLNNDNRDELTRNYVQYSSIASTILVVSIFIWFFSIVTAPIVLIYSLMHLNKNEGFFRGVRKGQKIVNIVLASMIIIGWLVLGITLILNRN